MRSVQKTIFEISKKGRKSYSLINDETPILNADDLFDKSYLREQDARLPEVSEMDLVRHFTNLSRRNHGIDNGFYPLGSCTMKYNPRFNEAMASLPGFEESHPNSPEWVSQGSLKIIHELEKFMCEIFGMDAFTLQPAAGAHGEFTGLLIIRAFHEYNGDTQRKIILVPDSAHGTNPASAKMAGFELKQVASTPGGLVDLEALKPHLNDNLAGMMLTNPNTLGLFEKDILDMTKLIHEAGGLLYYDGANANALLGISRPGMMGFDIVHANLHKTFSTPHGGGGPGSGPIGVKSHLEKFLPSPRVGIHLDKFTLLDLPDSIGRVKSFHGNFGVLVRAYAYIRLLGPEGLKRTSQIAVLNANYLQEKLKGKYNLDYDTRCMHEFVLSAERQKEECGVIAKDIDKALIDKGIHPPTTYFPLIVHEALMIEPTETESLETLDDFVDAMLDIDKTAHENPDAVLKTPMNTPVGRPDETKAARNPILKFQFE
ncbi:aminomethyl-transferring glycine dehydrogenase subunit GcvPB [bacterium]|nr:aminomethyl-transferring glycine dehydrogenase subunit GcvPB [bacterium]